MTVKFDQPLIAGRLIRRYKRFLADVELSDGTVVTAHCPNSGRMTTCIGPDWPVQLSRSDNPRRKLPYTLEMTHNGHCWIVVNTLRTNAIVHHALRQGHIPELAGFDQIRTEVPLGGNSRIDFLLTFGNKKCYLEVKSVTLKSDADFVSFPDAITRRGQKHLLELRQAQDQGDQAAVLFLVQRTDAERFRPAWEIDPSFSETLAKLHSEGLTIMAYQAQVTPQAFAFKGSLPVVLAKR